MRILLVYPNLPLMMSPSIAAGIFTALSKRLDVEFEMFETTTYSDQYHNRHLRMAEIGAVRQNKKNENESIFFIQPTSKIIPDYLNKLKEYQPDLIMFSMVEDVLGDG